MPQKLFIVTGSSKGLGHAIADAALLRGHAVAGQSRSPTEFASPAFRHYPCDLARPEQSVKTLEDLLNDYVSLRLEAIHLINNAGIVQPVGFARTNEPDGVAANVGVNLLAPMVLSAAFLRRLENEKCWRIITNVSSGVAYSPLPAWSAYSASKAGLRNFSICLSDETADDKTVRVYSFSPGIVDTEMQAVIRGTPEKAFPGVTRFRDYHRKGQLRDPREVAERLLGWLDQPSPPRKTEISVDEL